MDLPTELQIAMASDSRQVILRCPVLIMNYLYELSSDSALSFILKSVHRLITSDIDAVSEAMLDKLPQMSEILSRLKGSEFVLKNVVPLISAVPDDFNGNTVNVASHVLCVLIDNFYKTDFENSAMPFLETLAGSEKVINRAIALQTLKGVSELVPLDRLALIVNDLLLDDNIFVRSRLPALITSYAHRLETTEDLTTAMLLLAQDPEPSIRKAIIEQLFEYAQALPDSIRLNAVEPILLKILTDRICRSMINARIGAVISTLGSKVSREICAHYVSLLVSNCSDTQYSIAFSFPAVALALGVARFQDELLEGFKQCCLSNDIRVRRTLSFGLASFANFFPPTDLSFVLSDFLKDLPEVSIGVLSHLSDILPYVDDAGSLLFCLCNPTAKFINWRMRLTVSQQLRKCADFFDRLELFDSAHELFEDEVAVVRNDAVISFAELLTEEELSVVMDLATSENHWTRLCIVKVFKLMELDLANAWKDVLQNLLNDPVFAVREAARVAWKRLS